MSSPCHHVITVSSLTLKTLVIVSSNLLLSYLIIRSQMKNPNCPKTRNLILSHFVTSAGNLGDSGGGGGGGGANTKVPDMYGVGGCFRDPKHKSNMYTFVQQRGGGCRVSIFYPESQKYKWYFCTHIS